MAKRNILKGNDPALRKKSRAVADFNKRLHILLDDMRETLLEANGLGLAAPQVGVLRRVILVVDPENDSGDAGDQIIELVNPEIIAKSGEQTGSEGCLSIPGVYGIVTRPALVRIKAQDRQGNEIELWSKDLLARAICHEIDHLNGVVFTTLTDRFLTEEELEALAAEKESGGANGEKTDKEKDNEKDNDTDNDTDNEKVKERGSGSDKDNESEGSSGD